MDRQARKYSIRVESDLPFEIKKSRVVFLEEGERFGVPVRVAIDKTQLQNIKTDIIFTITAVDDAAITV